MSVYRRQLPDTVNAIRWTQYETEQYRFFGWLDANDIRINVPGTNSPDVGLQLELHCPDGKTDVVSPGQWLVRSGKPGSYVFELLDDAEFREQFVPVDD